MLIIRKNQVNNIIATVSMNKTLPNPYYLFSFQNIASKERISFIPEVITSNVRYDKFRFIETGNVNLSAVPPQVWFGNDLGQWYYSVYEQVSPTNTDISLAYNKLESGRAILMVGNDTNDCFFEPYISNDEDFSNIIYVSEEEELCISADTTISVFSQVLTFTGTPNYNSIQYRCDGVQVEACYSINNQNTMTDLVNLFNTPAPNPLPPSCNTPSFCYCWTDYGTYYNNGDNRVRCEMPTSLYNTLCSGGTITLNVIND
jgi:hypothetical protein